MASRIAVTLDSVAYDHKPEGREIGAITRRLQQAGPSELTHAEFAQAVARGHTWCGGTYTPRRGGWGEFQGLQVAALDFDNDTEVIGADGRKVKRPLLPNEAGYLDPWQAFARFVGMFGGTYVAIVMYPSFSFEFGGTVADPESLKTRMKYRLAYVLTEQITDERRAKALLDGMLRAFPEADRAARNVNRLYFGGSRSVLIDREGARYYGR